MTDLLPAPEAVSSPAGASGDFLDPDTVVDLGASVHADLGPDWSALRAFTTATAAVLGGAWVGRLADGAAGIVIGAGLVALVLFVAAHAHAWSTGRRIDRRAGSPVDTYASTGTLESRSVSTVPASYVWRCDVCRVVSIEASTRAQTADLASIHDRLHHGRPTAAVHGTTSPAGLAAPSTREAR